MPKKSKAKKMPKAAPKNLQVSVVLPTYNEAKNISILIPRIEKWMKAKKIAGEILVVDDSSPDGTAKVAEKLNKKYKNIRVVLRKKKEGIGAALAEGYDTANGGIIFSTDADLSFSVSYFIPMLAKLDAGFDVVVGSRFAKQSAYNRSAFYAKVKRGVSHAGNALNRMVTGIPVHDFSTNFRVFKKEVWEKSRTVEKSNSMLLEFLIRAGAHGFKIAEVPVAFAERRHGQSKMLIRNEMPRYLANLLAYGLKAKLGKL